MKTMKTKDYLFLIGALVLVFVVEFIAGLFTGVSVKSWYLTLNRPAWTPPAWIFGPVWTLLYIMMAVSLYLVWRKGGNFAAYFFWGLQLFLNFIWSFLFFTMQSPLLGLIDIILLWSALLITLILFSRISVWAAILLLPYLAWVSYALALNAAIWVLN